MTSLTVLRNLLLSIYLLASCQATRKNMQADQRQTAPFDTQGHRGARGLAPENTWPAMKAGLDVGVRTLEMDVVISGDSQVVVSHDLFFNHEISSKPDGSPVTKEEEHSLNLYQMDYADIARYDVGLRTHPRFPAQRHVKVAKPLLSGLLDQIATYMKGSRRPLPYFNIETKCLPATDGILHPAPPVFVELLMKVIREKNIADRLIIQSFDFRTLQYLHQHYPSVKTAMLVEADDKRNAEQQIEALGFRPTVYSPEHTLVTPALVKMMHERGILVIPWTVDDKARMDELRAFGVDGLISDFPNLF